MIFAIDVSFAKFLSLKFTKHILHQSESWIHVMIATFNQLHTRVFNSFCVTTIMICGQFASFDTSNIIVDVA